MSRAWTSVFAVLLSLSASACAGNSDRDADVQLDNEVIFPAPVFPDDATASAAGLTLVALEASPVALQTTVHLRLDVAEGAVAPAYVSWLVQQPAASRGRFGYASTRSQRPSR